MSQECLKNFENALKMPRECKYLIGASKMSQERLKNPSRMSREYLKNASECLENSSSMFQRIPEEYLKNASGMFQERHKNASKMTLL